MDASLSGKLPKNNYCLGNGGSHGGTAPNPLIDEPLIACGALRALMESVRGKASH
jgi:hypothetical protein